MTDISIFGQDVTVSEFWLMVAICSGGIAWSTYQLRKALKFGIVGFKACDYSRKEHPFEFKLYVSLWTLILACAILALIGWSIDYSSSP